MASVNKMMIATSIAPHISRRIQGVEYGSVWQLACINSWKAVGFDVVSLNTQEEIAALEPYTSMVDIVELRAGHHRPRIADFLEEIAKSSCEVAGIVNADCLLIPGTQLGERLAQNVDSLVMAERINISPLTMWPTGQHCSGFDAFFFNTAALANVDRDTRWRLGDTWWDYWFPLSLHLAGIKLKTLAGPVLAHLDHEQGWNTEAWENNGRYLIQFLKDRADELRDPYLATAMRAQPETIPDVHLLSCKIFHWLHAHEPLWQPEEGSAEDLAMRLNASLLAPPPQAVRSPAQSDPAPDDQPIVPQSSGRQNTVRRAGPGPLFSVGPLIRYRRIAKGARDYFRAAEYRKNRASPFSDQWARKALFQTLVAEFRPWAIVEMGAHHGETTEYLAGTGLPVFAAESNLHASGFMRARFWWRWNVRILHGHLRARLKSLLTGPLWKRRGTNPFFYLHAYWESDLPLLEVIEIIFCHCRNAIVIIDGFEVPGDKGYGFLTFASGKAMNADYIAPVATAHNLAAFYPSAPSQSESGEKRGCVILAIADIHGEKLASMLTLRK